MGDEKVYKNKFSRLRVNKQFKVLTKFIQSRWGHDN
jgi:hypothetical protein